MPSAPLRLALEVAFLVLVAGGAGLARFEPVVIVALMAVALVLVALVERASSREARLAAREVPVEAEPPRHVESVELEPVPVPEAVAAKAEPEPEPAPEPELAVSERSARAILASGPPPVPDPPAPEPHPEPEPEPEPEPPPEPQPEPPPEPAPEPEPVYSGPSREWNVWDLERLVRDRAEDGRQEEQAALVLSLRGFARADGTLPMEFDELVRESFGALLAAEHVTSRATAGA